MSADAIPEQRSAFIMRDRPKPVSALSATATLAWRAMLKIKHVPFQLFDVTITPIMFTLLFTYMFGGALGGTPTAYIQYLLPGILVQTIVFITVYTGVGLNTDIQKGLYDRFRSLPMWQPAPDPRRAVGRPVPLLGGVGADRRPGSDSRVSPGRVAPWACCPPSGWCWCSPSRCRGSGSSSA